MGGDLDDDIDPIDEDSYEESNETNQSPPLESFHVRDAVHSDQADDSDIQHEEKETVVEPASHHSIITPQVLSPSNSESRTVSAASTRPNPANVFVAQPSLGDTAKSLDRVGQIAGHVTGGTEQGNGSREKLRQQALRASKVATVMALSMLKELALEKPIHYPILAFLGFLRLLPRFLSDAVPNRTVFHVAATLAAYRLWKHFISGMEIHRLITGKVDHHSPLHGGHLAAHALRAHNVKAIFTLAGGHVAPVLVAAEEIGIRVVDVRDEATAVFAADGYARLTGGVGVAVVTAGPGLTNTITAVKNAQMAESPVLVISGAAATLLKGRGALQDIDQLAVMKPLCKSTHTATRVRSIPPTLLTAIQHALTPPMGPVYVELPIDTLYPISLVAKNVGASGGGGPGKGIGAALVESLLAAYVRFVFADAFEGFGYRQPTPAGESPLVPMHTLVPLPVPRTPFSQRPTSRALNVLLSSRRPVLLMGSQCVARGPEAARRVADAVRSLGVPVFLAGMSRGLLGVDGGGCQLRQVRKQALKTADVIVLAGITPDFRLDYGRVLSRKAKIIACNANPSSLRLNAGLFWTPEVAILGDPGDFVEALAKGVKGKAWEKDEKWVGELTEAERKKEEENRTKSLTTTAPSTLNPLSVLYALDRHLPADAILVADGGDFVGTAAYILRPRGPLGWLDPGAFGTLGVGAGFAIAAKVVHPERPVWVVFGDGSFGWAEAEVDTWVRHKLGIMAIIGNDAKWAQIAREQVHMLGRPTACILSRTADYAAAGRAMGGRGWTVKINGELDKVLEEAVDAAGRGEAGVLDVWIGETDFREGSVSV
ncbi:Thiamin diphosphate-binding protein [Gonapodya prolifera JEL478]|uniref:Thiamin diphosphate-binding protein n=1 Tax=Gonapodya prolifera (strain JEL478) TaxID=1344416 RepID=A0A139AD80_GONPJ|nr:Thiamin diphosphate-binding protein [Gonapodya prolifera JEL478]|eukprot:KXS14708.1 Thiamin diphosphate-binding protein [Gonapodya prolifera JEL478]